MLTPAVELISTRPFGLSTIRNMSTNNRKGEKEMGMYSERIKAQNEAYQRRMNPNAKPRWMTPSTPKPEECGYTNNQRHSDRITMLKRSYNEW